MPRLALALILLGPAQFWLPASAAPARMVGTDPGVLSQAVPARPAAYNPDWKHPGRGPIPVSAPLWQPYTPANPGQAPAWSTLQPGSGQLPGWSSGPPQGNPPTWRTPQQPTL